MTDCMNRPSHRELLKKIAAAKSALSERNGLFAHPAKAVGELNHLPIRESEDVWKLIQELLDEITPGDYAGGRPPQRSYEKRINGSELFAFSWQSRKLGKQMYLKFALRNESYYYVSLHISKIKRGREGI